MSVRSPQCECKTTLIKTGDRVTCLWGEKPHTQVLGRESFSSDRLCHFASSLLQLCPTSQRTIDPVVDWAESSNYLPIYLTNYWPLAETVIGVNSQVAYAVTNL